jgi:hypothetical protein
LSGRYLSRNPSHDKGIGTAGVVVQLADDNKHG